MWGGVGFTSPVWRADGVTLVDVGARGVVAVPGGDGGWGGSARAVTGVSRPTHGEDEAEPHHWLEAAAVGTCGGSRLREHVGDGRCCSNPHSGLVGCLNKRILVAFGSI